MTRQDIEKLLSEGNSIQLKPHGSSMYPLLVPGRDEVVIEPVYADKLKRGDVVLYRREGSILVLHRIYKKRDDEFYLVGDNQIEIEGPLKSEQMKGIMVGFVRKGRYIDAGNIIYRICAGIWLALRPIRPVISRFAHRIVCKVKKKSA